MKIIEEIAQRWASKEIKGNGAIYVPKPFDDKALMFYVLKCVYEKNPEAKCVILTETMAIRQEVIDYSKVFEYGDNGNNLINNKVKDNSIRVITTNICTRLPYNSNLYLTVLYHPVTIDYRINYVLTKSKFKLILVASYPSPTLMQEILSVSTYMDDFTKPDVAEALNSCPVEEMLVAVPLDESSQFADNLKQLNEYIATSLNIFGSFDIMKQCRLGNPATNMSANTMCSLIAESNGWNDSLDMSIEINKQIDELYNPLAIKERASQTYEFIRTRMNIVSSYDGKLNEIHKIVEENQNKSILIISKRSEFAEQITAYLNNRAGSEVCVSHHSKMEPIPGVDLNGNPIFYKGGKQKGKRKYIGEKAQKSLNEQKFNLGRVRVMSANNAPDKDLNITIDIVIITSPLCDTIEEYMYRFDKMYISSETLKLYTLYVKNSLEEQRLRNRDIGESHTIINEKNDYVIENNSNFILVD